MTRARGWMGWAGRAVGQTAGAALCCATLAGVPLADAGAASAVFPTPQAAAEAFADAVSSQNGQGLLDLFGAEHRDDLIGGDPAEARRSLDTLRRSLAEGMRVVGNGAGGRELVLGRNAWPMPIPLIETDAGWVFDVDAGLEEITNRRIGRNELLAIEACRAYITAQVEYASADRDGDSVREFAQKLVSSEGARDGLYWPASAEGDVSPLGPLVALSEQYLAYREAGESFHGYYFRVLHAQGPNPPGGAYDYVINGNMIAGHGLIAWPAEYGRSGIMTFLCGHHDVVLEKDFGESTAEAVAAITVYDADETWTVVE